MIASIGIIESDETSVKLFPLFSARFTPPLDNTDDLLAASAVRLIPEKASAVANPQAVILIVFKFIVISFVSKNTHLICYEIITPVNKYITYSLLCQP
jgi:hypothetical protein